MRTTEKDKRKHSLLRFGFGTEAMKSATVCTNCNSLENSRKMFCTKCGMRLSGANLYDFYKAQHKACCRCGAVLSDSMDYCTVCGAPVRRIYIQ